MTKNALAIFVKTAHLSPVKTRLAADFGKKNAETFYQLAVEATKSMATELTSKQNGKLTVYWAIAESFESVKEHWSDFNCIEQGDGSLGERLSHVYNQLSSKHQNVFFMGADSPHITAEKINLYINQLLKHSFLLGPTEDGGFYLFGGNLPLSKEIWTAIQYSQKNTASDLIAILKTKSNVQLVDSNFDIDTLEDLKKYGQNYFNHDGLSENQKKLIQWSKLKLDDLDFK